jgi:hypothetical protein
VATNTPHRAETNQASTAAAPATTNASVPQTNAPPPVANVLSLADIKEMAAKGVSEKTILNTVRAVRAIYTLTTQDVTELQEAKVGRPVIDYLLSTPLLYKEDLLRSRSYYYYPPYYPSYGHSLFHDIHDDVHHFDSHHDGLHH